MSDTTSSWIQLLLVDAFIWMMSAPSRSSLVLKKHQETSMGVP